LQSPLLLTSQTSLHQRTERLTSTIVAAGSRLPTLPRDLNQRRVSRADASCNFVFEPVNSNRSYGRFIPREPGYRNSRLSEVNSSNRHVVLHARVVTGTGAVPNETRCRRRSETSAVKTRSDWSGTFLIHVVFTRPPTFLRSAAFLKVFQLHYWKRWRVEVQLWRSLLEPCRVSPSTNRTDC
jgi:hypothetical protein